MGNNKWIWMLGILLVVGMISCKKGDTGPAGPAGPAGPDSVVYSSWIELTPTYNANDTAFEQTISAPSITQGILDSGIILSYLNIGTNGNSDVVPVSSLNYIFSLEEFTVGNIYLTIFPDIDLTGYPYRYVTIPGSKIEGNKSTGSVKGHAISELKSMPYEHVQEILGSD
jgi:hypothetical protein